MKKGDQRRDELMATAERLFYTKGYEGTSVQDILTEMNFSKGGFYHYFESKIALLEEICRQRAAAGLERIQSELRTGKLNPVSTNSILLGFRKVAGFTNGSENRTNLVASLFKPAESADYYKTSLFLRTNGKPMEVYLSDIGYDDDSEVNPISTAIRMGLVVHAPGKDAPVEGEYIFAINQDESIRNPEYNTYTGRDGYVLDLTSSDTEAVVEFEPYTSDNFCRYDRNTGETTLKPDSIPLFTLSGSTDAASGQYTGYGEAVQVDVYIWLEGCDQDCTLDILSSTLRVLSLSFAGIS